MSNKSTTPPITKSREDLRAASLSKAIDAIGQASFLPNLLDYLRVDVPFVGILLLLLDEKNRPHHIYDTIQTSFRINLDMYLDGVYQLDPFYTRFCKQKSTSAMLIRDVAPGWRPVPDDESQPTIRDIILTLPKIRDHGKIFEYKSVETDVVAWALERAANKSLAELMSELIWKKIGAEHNAFFTVDRAATALANGGFNASLRDYARFGLMMQNSGKAGNSQVVPASWVDDCALGDRSVYGSPYTDTCANGAYSNFWWVNNISEGDFMARGVFGQMIYINRATELTIVKLSTWPDYKIIDFFRDSLAAFGAIQKHLT